MKPFIIICYLLLPLCLWAQSPMELKSAMEHATSDSQKITAYNNLVTFYSNTYPDSAEYYGLQAIQFAVDRKYRLGEGLAIEHLGIIDKEQGRVDIAKKRITNALDIFRELHYLKGMAQMTNSLGAVEGSKGNYDVAIKCFIEALKLHDSLSDNEGLLLTYLNLGSLYMQHDDTANAWKYLSRAEKVSKSMPLTDATISLYNTLGVYAIAKRDSAKGLETFLSDLKLSDKPQFTSSHVECLSYLGQFYLDRGEPAKALEYLREGLRIVTEKNMPEMQSNLLLEIGQILEQSDPVSSMSYLTKAKEICEQMHNRRFLIYVYQEIITLDKQKGEYKEALAAFEEKDRLADSIFSIDKAREIASLSHDYELDQSRARVSELEVVSTRNAWERNITGAIAISIVLLLIILLFFFRRSVLLNKQLTASKEQLRELNSMKDKLFSIIGHDLRGHIARIPNVLDMYNDESTTAEDKEFLLSTLKEHSKGSLETLDKLLFWGRSLVKGTRIDQVNFHAKGYITEAIEFKKMAAAEKQITVTDKTPEHLSAHADVTHFDFIIRNLLANAIKYTFNNGKIEINAESVSRPGFIVFAVKDNGVGIAKEAKARIFSSLNSAPGTANEIGNGIGLMLCKEFALQNGGDIWLESEEGEGTTFYFSLKKSCLMGLMAFDF